jgi:signal recognition particle receptor subunit beta
MVFFNWATMQMAAKIVYYGPGLCGKTSNLSYIYAKTAPGSRGEMVSLETESDRTLFFDLLPIEVGNIGGFKTRLQLYTVPGQVFYNTTRKLVLKGVDGLVFVADSQRPMRDANVESFDSLVDNLKEFGLEISDLPLVLQYNKRDLGDILSIDELNSDLNPDGTFNFHEASAVNGDGVIETLKDVTKLTLKKLKVRMTAPDDSTAKTKISGPTVRPVRAPQPAQTISARSLARAAEEGVGDENSAATEEDAVAVGATAAETEDIEESVVEPASEEAAAASPAEEGRAEQIGESPEEETVQPPGEEAPAIPGDEPPPAETSDEDAAEVAVQAEPPSPEEAPQELRPEPESADKVPEEEEDETVEIIDVSFDAETADEPTRPPDVKRVQVSNQMDILAELDSLRKQATMGGGDRRFERSTPDLDLDSLISGDLGNSRELRHKVEQSLNSDIFKNMRGMQIAIRIQDGGGETIHTFDSVSVDVEDATALKKLRLRFSLDLENLR